MPIEINSIPLMRKERARYGFMPETAGIAEAAFEGEAAGESETARAGEGEKADEAASGETAEGCDTTGCSGLFEVCDIFDNSGSDNDNSGSDNDKSVVDILDAIVPADMLLAGMFGEMPPMTSDASR